MSSEANKPLFESLLIANRGEIACRVIKTCRALDIRSIAIYSDADASARHVRLADEAIHIGPANAALSYLSIEKVIAAAKQSGAQAIHPGYGFLSENADFARACEKNGIVFIGPKAETIVKMGSKAEAKKAMKLAGVPLVPGYEGDKQDLATLAAQADTIGYPLLIKASAGGGGRGLRLVHEAAAFKNALQACKRESLQAFANDHVILEKYIESPRHIEVQIFGDRHGNAIHLFERDCSTQRRHQKLLEEAPSQLSKDARAALHRAAIKAAQAVGYINAGTVEFLVDSDERIYFIEMNTRLQVEHPATEMITSMDLVKIQLRVAAGEALPDQKGIHCHGHAIEARIYAEDPSNDFVPSTGLIKHYQLAKETETVRIDNGFSAGDIVSSHYDTMLTKLIVHGSTREEAIKTLSNALHESYIDGIKNNIAFLRQLSETDVFRQGTITTSYLDKNIGNVIETLQAANDNLIAAAAIALSLTQMNRNAWQISDSWQATGSRRRYRLQVSGKIYAISVATQSDQLVIEVNGQTTEGSLSILSPTAFNFAGDIYHYQRHQDFVHISSQHRSIEASAEMLYPYSVSGMDEKHPGAPMPGRIVEVFINEGDDVAEKTPLLVLEGMKIEYTLRAPSAGRVTKIHYKKGDMVEAEVPLVDIE